MNSTGLLTALLLGTSLLGAAHSYFMPGSKTRNILINIIPSFLILILAIKIAWLATGTEHSAVHWDWFTIGTQVIRLTFEFNRFTIPLMVLVSAISFLVHLYSLAYMKEDDARPRFFGTLALFTFSMLGLTLSGNLLQLIMFWELVGLCSYLLIGFYRSKPEAGQAASKALLINKIGDAGFLVALMAVWVIAGTLNIADISINSVSTEWRTFIGIAILIAVLAKSAQFPFHTWLPDAMVGPTPVSALIHSATMVAAGVFLLVRLQVLFTPFTLQLVAGLGGITAFIGGINAIRENDLKRFLAWSTLSQLGLMVMVIGSHAFDAAYIHLISHAIFKAGLFLAIGILIQHYHIKSFTDNAVAPTVLFRVLTIGLTLALMGMPFTIGFLSKEIMLASAQSPFVGIAAFILNFITAFYCGRLLMFIRPVKNIIAGIKIPTPMLSSVLILAVASLWFFYSWSPFSMDGISNSFLVSDPSSTLTFLSIGVLFFGMASGVGFIRQGKMETIQKLIPVIPYDQWLKFLFVKPVLAISEMTSRSDVQLDRGIHLVVYLQVGIAHLTAWFDRYIIDGFVNGLTWISRAFGNLFRKLGTGQIQDYIWWTVIAVIVIIISLVN